MIAFATITPLCIAVGLAILAIFIWTAFGDWNDE